MLLRVPVLLMVLTGICALVPLAYASPPDPAWIGGIYDDADFDDVVVAVTGAHFLLGSALPVSCEVFLVVVGSIPPEMASGTVAAPPSAARTRAPPLA